MSLLLDALKKAEQAKQASARGAPDPDATMPGGRSTPLMTRDRLPDIAGLELVPDDLAPPPRTTAPTQRSAPSESPAPLQLAEDRPAGATAPSGPQARKPDARRAAGRPAEDVAADRQAARQVFEAKQMDYNPKRGYYATLGLLGLLGLGVAGYFWWEMQPKSGFVVANAPPPTPAAQTAQQAAQTAAAQPSAAAQPPASAPAAPPPPPAAAVAPAPPAAASVVAAPPSTGAPVAAAPPETSAVPGTRGTTRTPASAAKAEPPMPPQPMAASAPRPRPAPPPSPEGAAPAERRAPMAIVPTRTLDRELDNAYTAFEAGDYSAARRSYQQVLRADPTNRDAMLGLAAIDLRAGDEGAAQARYQKLIERDPRDPYAHAAIVGLRPSADPVQSESRLKTLIGQQPDSAPLQFALGNLYSGQSRWSEAQAAYFKAYSGDPDNADFAYNLAVSLDHLRQPRLALEYYQRALALAGERPVSFDRARAAARARDLER